MELFSFYGLHDMSMASLVLSSSQLLLLTRRHYCLEILVMCNAIHHIRLTPLCMHNSCPRDVTILHPELLIASSNTPLQVSVATDSMFN